MVDPGSPDTDAFVAVFLRLLLEDRLAGRDLPVEHYLGRFPGREDTIRRAFGESSDTTLPEVTASAAANVRTIGHYRLIRQLGRGGQGEVFLADDTRLRRRVAIKMLSGFGAASPEYLDRFRREAELASRLDHPAISTVYETGVEGGIPYIVMRFVEGKTLAACIADERTAPAPLARGAMMRRIELIENIARALQVAHEGGIVHRDIKPGNVMVAADGSPVILDFGLAREIDGDSLARTRTGDVFGTPAYLAPEQIETPPRAPDQRSDVYALGVTLYEALTRHRPFEAPTREALYQAILRGAPPDPRAFNPAIAADLRLVMLTAIERDRDRRYQTAADLAEDLRRIRAHEPILARPIGPLLRLRRWVSRAPMRAAFVALVIVVAAASGYFAARWADLRSAAEFGRERAQRDQRDAVVERGYILLTAHENDAACAGFAAVLARDPLDLEAFAGQVLGMLDARRDVEVLTMLDAASPAIVAEPGIRSLRAIALEHVGRSDESKAIVRDIGPPQDPLSLFLAAHRVARREFDEPDARRQGLRFMTACITAGGVRTMYLFEMARLAFDCGDRLLIDSITTAIEGRAGDTPRAHFWLGMLLRRVNPERSVVEFDRAMADRLITAQAHLGKAAALITLGKPDEALRDLDQLIAAVPHSAEAYFYVGQAHQRAGRAAAAETAFRRSIEIDPDHPISLNNLGNLLRTLDRNEEAVPLYERATTAYPEYAAAWANLAAALRSQNRPNAAQTAIEHALSLTPDDVRVVAMAGEIARDRYDLEASEAYLRRAVGMKPEIPVVRVSLALTLEERGRFREAAALDHATAESSPTDPLLASRARKHEANCLAQAVQESTFEQYLQRQLEPSSPAQKVSFADLARRRGMSTLGLRLYQEALAADPDLANDGGGAYRYSAARCAAQAAKQASGTARTELLSQAIAYLEGELSSWRRRMEDGEAAEADTQRLVGIFDVDSSLDLLRDPTIDATLTPDLATRRRAIWSAINGLRASR